MKLVFPSLLLIVTTGCGGGGSGGSDPVDDGLIQKAVMFIAPSQIANSVGVVFSEVFATVTFNDVEQGVFVRSDDGINWSKTINVSGDASNRFTVNWFETFEGNDLKLGESTGTVEVALSDGVVVLDQSGFVSNGFDQDGDGFSNLDERNEGFDPIDVNSNQDVPDPLVKSRTVRVPRIILPVEIDGLIDGAWENAAVSDDDGAALNIDKLMIDNRSDSSANAAPENTWRVMHDGNFLYLLIETVDGDVFNDSVNGWNDDNLNLYWDGNYSRGNMYDGVDDFHIHIPLRNNPGGSSNNNVSGDSRFFQGGNSADLPIDDIAWATDCVDEFGKTFCTYEVRMFLSSVKIPLGQNFGFDVHLDDDDDGGARDTKWGWHHPERQGSDIDFTDNAPKFMGTLILE